MMNSKVIQKPVITKDSNLDAAGGKRKKAATTANGKLQQRGIGSFFSKK